MCPPSSKLRGKGLGTNMEFSRARFRFFLSQAERTTSPSTFQVYQDERHHQTEREKDCKHLSQGTDLQPGSRLSTKEETPKTEKTNPGSSSHVHNRPKAARCKKEIQEDITLTYKSPDTGKTITNLSVPEHHTSRLQTEDQVHDP